MKLESEFFKLPFLFDPERLAFEVGQFSESDWHPHPQEYAGNSYLPLVSVGGDTTHDGMVGAMLPTPHLERCPYLRQVIAALGTVVGRSRLMRIDGLGEAVAHIDLGYYWSQRVRVHIPAITFPSVRFQCGGREVHMAAGECWIFDTWRMHNVINADPRRRIHLVVDTVGSPEFWEAIEAAERPFSPSPIARAPRFVGYTPKFVPPLQLERVNFPTVMTPWEIQCILDGHFSELIDANNDAAILAEIRKTFQHFLRNWRSLWARFGDDPTHASEYRAALTSLGNELTSPNRFALLPNGYGIREVVRQQVLIPAVKAEGSTKPIGEYADKPSVGPRIVRRPTFFDRPVFIVSAPRSGSSLLFETLAQSPDFHTIGGESHGVFESIPELRPQAKGFESNRLVESDATPAIVETVHRSFRTALRDRNRVPIPVDCAAVRMLEKTPKNSLRIPFLLSVFPDALFIYLHRDPAENIASMIEAWLSNRFVTYAKLPEWDRPTWSLALIPGWRELRGKTLAEIAAAQWSSTNTHILDDLARLSRDRWCKVGYSDFLDDPKKQVERLCSFAGVSWDRPLGRQLPIAAHTLTPPSRDKWRAHAAEIEPLLPRLEPLRRRIIETT